MQYFLILLTAMKKEVYIMGGGDGDSYTAFRDRMMAVARESASILDPVKMWLTVTETPPPMISVIPFKRKKIAAISMIRRDEDRLPAELLISNPGFRSAFEVEEAIPVSYSKSWKSGTVTPGVCLLTLFRPRKGISYETFIDIWHNSHTPLSLRIHPLWHYNRNVVKQPIAPGEPPWGGIVEEHFRTRADLLNPFLFFGNPLVIIQHMVEVYRDTKAFIDYSTMETYMVREYHLK
jgi:hypothetical protein